MHLEGASIDPTMFETPAKGPLCVCASSLFVLIVLVVDRYITWRTI